MYKSVTLFIAMSLMAMFITAQPELTNSNFSLTRKALRMMDNGNYRGALDLLLPIYQEAEDKNELARYMAECYFELHQEEQIKVLIKGLQSPTDDNLLDLALAYYHEEKFDSASMIINGIESIDQIELKQDIQGRIKRAEGIYAEEDGIIIQNFGKGINSGQREYQTVMYHDYNTLLFTTRKYEDEKRDVDGMAYEAIYLTTVDSLGDWTTPVPIKSDLVDERRHDAPIQKIDDGQKIITFHDGSLYESELKGGTWERGSKVDIRTGRGLIAHCHITEDHQTIYFSSDLKYPGEDLDLYQSEKLSNGTWSAPIPIEELNTEFDEDAPFLAKDGTLYFSSRGHGSVGGYDVFKTRFDSTTNTWHRPERLPYPINTVDEDIYFSMEGKVGYISSTRKGGEGSLDIYRVFLFNKIKVTGKVEDDSGNPIADAKVSFDYDSSRVYAYSDINGDFEVFLPILTNMHVTIVKNSQNLHEGDYIIKVKFKDKNENEFSFAITEEEEMPASDVGIIYPAHDIPMMIPIGVRNDFNLNPILANVPKKLERHWADSLNYTADKVLEMAKAAEEQRLSASPVNSMEMNQDEPFDRSENYAENKPKINLFPNDDYSVYFDTNSSELRKEEIPGLEEFILQVKESNKAILLINGYADHTGTEEFNFKLSFRRCIEVYNFFTSRGIDGSNLILLANGEIGGEENLDLKRKVEIKWKIDEESE